MINNSSDWFNWATNFYEVISISFFSIQKIYFLDFFFPNFGDLYIIGSEIFLIFFLLGIVCFGLFLEVFIQQKHIATIMFWLFMGFFTFLLLWNIFLFLELLKVNIVSTEILTSWLVNGWFIDSQSIFFKCLICLIFLIFLIFSYNNIIIERLFSLELFILFIFLIFGLFLLVSTDNFLTGYLAIELQSFILYLFASSFRFLKTSTEAGLKYFIIGSVASALYLLGVVCIYSDCGSFTFSHIEVFLWGGSLTQTGFVGFLFLFVSIFIKLGIAPFHLWVPDVYDGSPFIFTGLFATLSKIGLFGFLLRICQLVFFDFASFAVFFLFTGVFSIAVGNVGALHQWNIKRLVAYSGIGHFGFIFLALAVGTSLGRTSSVAYFCIYLLTNILFFGLLFSTITKSGKYPYYLHEFSSILRSNKLIAINLMLVLFSMAGVPPLAGFFMKFYVILAAVESGFFIFSALALIFSIVSAYYYLRLIVFIYSSSFKAETIKLQAVQPVSFSMAFFLSLLSCFNFFYIGFSSFFLSLLSCFV